MVAVLLFAAFMHLYLIGSYPPGLDSDAATDGLDSLKLTRYGIALFYIVINANTDPLFIYTATATSWLFGSRVIALRLPSAFFSILSFATTYVALAELARGEFDSATRKRIAVIAVAALAVSQPIAFFNRMGLRFSTQDVIQMAAIWALAKALRVQTTRQWVVAGALVSLTQYTYPAARVLPLLFGLIFLIKAPPGWWRDKNFWRGVRLCVLAATIIILPQLIWYAFYPDTFLARAWQTSLRNNPIYDQLGLWGTLFDKFDKYRSVLSSYWQGQYDQIKEPLLPPLFYYGFLIGIVVMLVNFRKRFTWIVLMSVAVMVLPDIIFGDRDWPHEFRLTGAYPFIGGMVGLGFGGAIGWLKRWPTLQTAASLALIVGVVITASQQSIKFFGDEGGNWGKMKWGGNTWLKRVAAGNGKFIAKRREPILVPLNDYARTPIKYLASNRAQVARSAIDVNGQWIVGLDMARVLLPHDDDEELWHGDATQWVLFLGNTVYILPPSADVSNFLPLQTDDTLIRGEGVDDKMNLGHFGTVDWSRLGFAPIYQPQIPMHICFKTGACLIGASYSDAKLQSDGTLRVQLFWTSSGKIWDEYLIFVHLVDRNQNAIARNDEYPLRGAYHTYEWRNDETIITVTDIKLPKEIAPGAYGLQVGFYLPFDLNRVKTEDESDRAYFVHLKSPRPAIALPENYTPLDISFADEVTLIGYRIDSTPAPDRPLKLTVWWRGDRHATVDWISFFHLTPKDDLNKLIAQSDQPIGGTYPSTVWDEDEIVEDHIEINGEFASGDYAVWVGLYSPITSERAAIRNSPNAIQDNRTLLVEINVAP